MRERLKPHCDQRLRFIAAFERFSYRKDHKKRKVKTVLLTGVYTADQRYMCDHIWFNTCEGFDKHDLKKGDLVEFSARVSEYRKYALPKRVVSQSHSNLGIFPFELDYTLTRVRDVKRRSK